MPEARKKNSKTSAAKRRAPQRDSKARSRQAPQKAKKPSAFGKPPFSASIFLTAPLSTDRARPEDLAAFPGATLLYQDSAVGEWQQVESAISTRLDSGNYSEEDWWAVLPADFFLISGMTMESLGSVISGNPGHAVYFFQLNPVDEAIFPNPWARSFLEAPGFADFLPPLLKVMGEGDAQPLQIRSLREFHSFPCLVGQPTFWRAFLEFVSAAIAALTKALSAEQKRRFKKPIPAPSRNHHRETYQGLMCRQLFPFFLARLRAELKPLKVLLPTREKSLNAHVRSLRQLREASLQSKALWLASAWLSYRNLYLLGVNGRSWCERNLPAISPSLTGESLGGGATEGVV